MQADCSDRQLIFGGFAGRKVVADFNGGAVTSHGGALLLREADRAIGLTGMVARCFRDGRAAEDVVHRIETLVAQRIHGLALGYEDLNDHDELRHDPVLGPPLKLTRLSAAVGCSTAAPDHTIRRTLGWLLNRRFNIHRPATAFLERQIQLLSLLGFLRHFAQRSERIFLAKRARRFGLLVGRLLLGDEIIIGLLLCALYALDFCPELRSQLFA